MKNIYADAIDALSLCSVTLVFAHSGKHEGGATLTKHFNETLFAISEKGQVSIEILLDEKEYKIGKDMVGIVVHDGHDEDVEEAKLHVTVSGNAEPLKVKEKGGGLYLMANDALPKGGTWELKVTVRKKKIDDSATFLFPEVLQKRLPAGKYDADKLTGK